MKRLLRLIGAIVILGVCSHCALADPSDAGVAPAAVKFFFDTRGRTVVTFLGYSGAGYEDTQAMLDAAKQVLSGYSPNKTFVNIGATSSGIGAVYEVAKQMGFETAGIVSTQARQYKAEISPYVDNVFFVTDDTWGGFEQNSEVLSPTSEAIVQSSDIFISIGGGAVARDELIAARRAGKETKYIPADMNHKKAVDKARKQGLPMPTDFKGEAFAIFGQSAGSAQSNETKRQTR